MIRHLTHSDNYLKYLTLRGKQKKTKKTKTPEDKIPPRSSNGRNKNGIFLLSLALTVTPPSPHTNMNFMVQRVVLQC